MILNPNDELVSKIKFRIELLGGYCPCKPEKFGDVDYICPCKDFREKEECCCQLFVEEV